MTISEKGSEESEYEISTTGWATADGWKGKRYKTKIIAFSKKSFYSKFFHLFMPFTLENLNRQNDGHASIYNRSNDVTKPASRFSIDRAGLE